MIPGDRVRLKGDPAVIGFATERTRLERDRMLMLVKFTERDRWVPMDQIELVPEQETPLDLLLNAKFGHASDLRRTITHVRLTGRLADVIYSMEATNTDFYAYQFKPVLKMLLSPSNSLLIADEVGLGKTIEAGLIWTELRSRFDMKRLLVLCPAVLREKWQDELDRRMGVQAEIVDAKQVLKVLDRNESHERGFAMIASLQGLRPPRGWDDDKKQKNSFGAKLARFLEGKEHDDKLVDLLIVDEAHYLRNPETQTNTLGQQFRAVSEYACFLSATPVHNKSRDLFSLLNILDPETFRRMEDFQRILEANAPLVKARDLALSINVDKDQIQKLLSEAHQHPLLRRNRQLSFLHEFIKKKDIQEPENRSHLAYRLETVNLLGHAVTRTRKREVKEWRVLREPIDELVIMSEVEDEFYAAVTKIVSDYSLSRDINVWFLLATPQRMLTSSMPAAFRAWRKKGMRKSDFEDDLGYVNDLTKDEIGPLTEILAHDLPNNFTYESLAANDSKYARLKSKLSHFEEDYPGEKVVLFSTFRSTLQYLYDRLSLDGFNCVVLKGGMTNKDDVIRQFSSKDGARILLSSEVGGEGIDLQFCRVVINYDLPWNPMRVEQRIGRLDRIGQLADKILIWNLIYEGTIDARIYHRLYQKLDLCRQTLGDFEAILGDEIKELTRDLLQGHLSPEQQEERIDQTALALENRRIQEEELEQGASQLVHYGDYILNQIYAAKNLHRWISERDLRSYVLDYLRFAYPGGTYQQLDKEGLDYEITLSEEAKYQLENFMKKMKFAQQTKLTRSSHVPVRCRFENKVVASSRERVEIISQFHPIVRFVGSDIEERDLKLRPAVSIILSHVHKPDDLPMGHYVLAGSRWSVTGLQGSERLVFRGKQLDSDGQLLNESDAEHLAAIAAMEGRDWPQVTSIVDLNHVHDVASHELFGELRNNYDNYIKEVRAQNDDRIDIQLRSLNIHRENQIEKFERIRLGHQYSGRESLVKATEGRIKALQGRVDIKTRQLEQSRILRYDFEEVCVVLVNIQ